MHIVERRIGLAEFKEERFELLSTPLFGPSHGEADEPFYVFDLIGALMGVDSKEPVALARRRIGNGERSFVINLVRSRYSDVQQMRLSPRIGIGKEALFRSTAKAWGFVFRRPSTVLASSLW